MLYLTEAQSQMMFSILGKNNQVGRLLAVNYSLISSRNELGSNRFSLNRYQHSLADVEVLILAVVFAHYPKTTDELFEEIKREYSDCGFFSQRGNAISLDSVLRGLIDKEFLVYRENSYFLNMTHLDPDIIPIVLTKLVETQTAEMSVDAPLECFIAG